MLRSLGSLRALLTGALAEKGVACPTGQVADRGGPRMSVNVGAAGVVPRGIPAETGLRGLDAVGYCRLVVESSLPAPGVFGSAAAIMPTSFRPNLAPSRQNTRRGAPSRHNRKVGIRADLVRHRNNPFARNPARPRLLAATRVAASTRRKAAISTRPSPPLQCRCRGDVGHGREAAARRGMEPPDPRRRVTPFRTEEPRCPRRSRRRAFPQLDKTSDGAQA